MRIFLTLALVAANACHAALYINEIQSGNTQIPDDVGSLTSDWVEIYNSGASAVNLGGYHLSDSTSNPAKWTFPNVTIQPNGFLIVWASNINPPPSPMHANFAISSGGETILLSDSQGALLDQFPPVVIATDVSMGRKPEGAGNLFFFNTPTPGAANSTPGTSIDALPAPAFSVPGGMFTNNVSLSMSTDVQGATIRYTLDGSEPTASSPAYSGPLTLTNPSNNNNVLADVPTNYLDPGSPFYEGWQPPNGKVFKINVVRARVFKAGSDPGEIATQSYLVDPQGTARYQLPVVSVVTARPNLVDPDIGIYVPGNYNNYTQKGGAWERPGHIEFFETGGSLAFADGIGIRINGNTTRNRPRKALRIYNRDASKTFNYQIYPEKDVSKFDTLILRAAGNDWGQSLFRDAFSTTLGQYIGMDYQSSRPVVVFLTGEYWGIHNVRDRLSEGYFKHHHGLNETDFTVLEIAADNQTHPIVDTGEPSLLADFEDILNKASNNEFASPAGLASLAQRIDLDNFTDYQIINIWSGNTDWPGNNVLLWRTVAADNSPGADPKNDARWRWILKDMDFSLGLNFIYVPGVNEGPNFNSLAYASTDNFNTSPAFIGNQEMGTRMLRKLLDNTEYRDKFINRAADLLNSLLAATNMVARVNAFQGEYSSNVVEHTNRWRQPVNWTNEVSRIRNYVTNRPAALRGHIVSRFNLSGTTDVTLDVSGDGVITINSLRVAPETPGISTNPYPWVGTYFQGVPVTISAEARPGYRFVSWSAADSGGGGTNILASDSTANYGTNWPQTPNGGTGFTSWIFNDTDSYDDGFFIGSSGRSIHAESPDGRSFGIFAHGNGHWANVARPFGSGTLQAGQTFSVKVSPGGFSGIKGVEIGADGTNRFGFFAGNDNGQSRYWFVNDGNLTVLNSTFSPDVNSTFNVSVTRNSGNNEYTMAIVRNGTTFITNFTSSGAVDRAYFFNAGSASSADSNNLYFNLLSLSSSGGEGGTNSVIVTTNSSFATNLVTAKTFTANFEPEAATRLEIEAPGFWAIGTALPTINVMAATPSGDPDPAFTGTVTLTITGPDGFSQQYNVQAVDGVASFGNISLPAVGTYNMSAESGSLSTEETTPLVMNDAAVFLPSGNDDWNLAANWDIGAVPNGTTARAKIQTIAADRNINLTADITVQTLIFDNENTSNRNRVRNNGVAASLTMQAADGPATIKVIGDGVGHANLEFNNPGALILGGDLVLDVQNAAAGNAEYGALRLQGNVSGVGGIIKRGPGIAGLTGAGKTFSGDVVIEQGVLTFSEPAISGNNVTNYTVQPGGQLRLSSAGAPRNYLFKGPLNLAGNGRTGVPEEENMGVLGALRLETGSTGTTAVLTNQVNITADADVHVTAGNTVRLEGPLQGGLLLTKSGGGTLTIAAGASGYAGSVTVNRGVVALDGAALTSTTNDLTLINETVLAGTGRWGGTLQAQAGSTLAFGLGAEPGAAQLRVTKANAAGQVIVSVTPATNSIIGIYPLLVVDDTFTGTNNFTLALNSTNYPASQLVVADNVLALSLRNNMTDRERWLDHYDLPIDGTGDGADDADPDHDGIKNILERAFGLNPVVADATLPVTISLQQDDVVTVTYHVAKNQSDITVTPQGTGSLEPGNIWTNMTPVMVDDANPGHTVYKVELPAAQGAGFVRFIVTGE